MADIPPAESHPNPWRNNPYDSARQTNLEKIREVRRKAAAGFYNRPNVVRATARRILESKDLPLRLTLPEDW